MQNLCPTGRAAKAFRGSNKPAGACMYVSVPGPPGIGTDCAIRRRSVGGHSGSGSMSSRGTSLMRVVAALRMTARGLPDAIRGTPVTTSESR